MQPTNMELAGEPEESFEVSFEEALDFAADVVGHSEYVLTYKIHPGFAS